MNAVLIYIGNRIVRRWRRTNKALVRKLKSYSSWRPRRRRVGAPQHSPEDAGTSGTVGSH